MARNTRVRIVQPATQEPAERYCPACALWRPAEGFTTGKPYAVPGTVGRHTRRCGTCSPP